MRPVLARRSEANKIVVNSRKTLGALLDEQGLTGRLDEVALYNWGTKVPAEINRALVELVGCSKTEADPLQSMLDPDLGTTKVLYTPDVWKPDAPLTLDTVHTVKVRRRLPVPAVSISKLTRWFIPETGTCEAEYVLEGVAASADKVDFEVHAHGYHSLSDKGKQEACDTDAAEAGSTHLFRKRKWLEVASKRPPPGAQKLPDWKGESEATQGVLEKKGAGTYIHFGCAPYDVLVRYYKDDKDHAAKVLLSPFVPRWKPVKGAAPVLDDASLVVTWELAGDNGKLKRGQLVVWDKDDQVVFFAPLDENQLRNERRFDFVKDARKKWDRAQIQRDKLPYRVQLQAHSDENEEKGLALAVMPTQVRVFDYDRVQFIAFNVKPGTKPRVPGPGTDYLGAANADVDIQKRCDVMRDAIRLAAGDPQVSAEERVLKLFMAPEFYFRGQEGGYPVEKLSDITQKLREETDRATYADWLFVFGTAIGYLPHEALHAVTNVRTGTPLTHRGESRLNADILEVDLSGANAILRIKASRPPGVTWKVRRHADLAIQSVTPLPGGEYRLTLNGTASFAPGAVVLIEPVAWIAEVDTTGPSTRVRVASALCPRIFVTATGIAPSAPWKIRDASEEDDIVACAPTGGGDYWLTLASNKAFAVGAAALIEPVATEVFNVALVQKGWPAPLLGEGLKAAAIFKENISAIDFVGPNSSNVVAWYDAKGGGRLIEIHGETNRQALPTDGSADLLGTNPNRLGGGPTWVDPQGRQHTVGSEVNLTGDGGGSVISVDGITLGLEVCLDHASNRLGNFYNGAPMGPPSYARHPATVKAGDPRVQIQLIPSWGMSIGRGELVTLPGGATFNVDGQRCGSVARVSDSSYSCDDHPDVHSPSFGTCTRTKEMRWCATCNKPRGAPGDCPGHGPPETRHFCSYRWQRWHCGLCFNPPSCATHSASALPSREAHLCSGCNAIYWASGPCHVCGRVQPASCGKPYSSGGTCPDHVGGPSAPQLCNTPYKPMGKARSVVSGPTDVNSSQDPLYFEEGGHILVYEAQSLPPPDLV